MELWIRSQNKEILQRTNALFIAHSAENIWSIIDNQNMTKYGEYTTRERALEVLDEIQNILQSIVIYKEPKIDYNDDNFIQQMSQNILLHSTQQVEMELKQAGQIVYEMPIE